MKGVKPEDVYWNIRNVTLKFYFIFFLFFYKNAFFPYGYHRSYSYQGGRETLQTRDQPGVVTLSNVLRTIQRCVGATLFPYGYHRSYSYQGGRETLQTRDQPGVVTLSNVLRTIQRCVGATHIWKLGFHLLG